MAAPPPLRGPAGNLPAELTTFVDRRQERGDIKRAFSATRLLTLTGFGGVGKTRLALRAAQELRRAFPDGVWFVELAALDNPALLADTVAEALGLRAQTTRSTGEALIAQLRHRDLLLVLDNCEHLLDDCAALVETLLHACPDLRVLATSREPLGVANETVLPVSPLTTPREGTVRDATEFEAMRLFADRAGAAHPAFELTKANQDVIAEICRRLDGIPLALELAAVRLRSMSPGDLLARLSERLLTSGSHTTPERQRTLRGCIDWSYDLCTPAERHLWALASVFAGDFQLDALEAVCRGDETIDGHVPENLVSLTEKSIILSERHDGRTRYRMLEVIRHYGLQRLRETGRGTAARRAHRDFYAELVAHARIEWFSDRQRESLARIRLDQPNLRTAFEFCAAEPGESETGLRMAVELEDHWLALGAVNEGMQWFERLLASGPVSPACRATALATAGWLAVAKGDLATARPLIETATNLAQDLDDTTKAATLVSAGALAVLTGDLARGIRHCEEALATYRATGDRAQEIGAVVVLQMAYYYAGEPERALATYDSWAGLAGQTGDPWQRSYAIWNAGLAHLRLGNTGRAIDMLRESLRVKRETTDELGLAYCLEALATATADSQPCQAATILGVAAALWETMGTSPTDSPWAGREDHDRTVTELRTTLGMREFEQAFHRGRELDRDEGLDIAAGKAGAISSRPPEPRTTTQLTPREQQVAKLVGRGLTNREIAGHLVISLRTAETHVENILAKLGFTSRTQIATWMANQRER